MRFQLRRNQSEYSLELTKCVLESRKVEWIKISQISLENRIKVACISTVLREQNTIVITI